jgi:3-hydroxyisobutyrate dehydrogenase-like beta-hydroxyacid dehydrogenase
MGLGIMGEAMTVKGIRRGHIGAGSTKAKRKVQVRNGKMAANPGDLVSAEKPILGALRRVRRKARIERLFG